MTQSGRHVLLSEPTRHVVAVADDSPSEPNVAAARQLLFSTHRPIFMPRNHAGPSTLRNRNRVTNKTRLKVIKESIDADLIILDEDVEKARVVSTAGVDAEDANEHHLQAVLAAATRQQSIARSTRAASEKGVAAPPAAYIPTPDSTGVVSNYEELYRSRRWTDAATYVKSSDTVEETTSFALTNGFIYYMDERDKDWLDKHNEEARGEGTSAQGAASISSASTRSSRSAKASGKEPETSTLILISEDEFELVMAIYEKVTHDKTAFLHHGLDQGSPFPPFSDYQDTFEHELRPDVFALYAVPSWIPKPEKMIRLARAIYSHWKERRVERNGHPILPVVNLDEADVKNESYICFRRRESKAMRKTRAQQATFSDKMCRLQNELGTAMELASAVIRREQIKQVSTAQSQAVWEARLNCVDLKRKCPSMFSKQDDELFHDKERVVKKPKTEFSGRVPLKVRTHDNNESSPSAQEPMKRPKEIYEQIQRHIDHDIEKRREKDRHWEDMVDNPYQPSPTPYSSRLFKAVAASRASSIQESHPPSHRGARLRFGRGGRLLLDRRSFSQTVTSSPFDEVAEDDVDARDRERRLAERWKYDEDDVPVVGVGGPDEQDRKMVDDFAPTYLSHSMTLLSEHDHHMIETQGAHALAFPEPRLRTALPYKGMPSARNDQRSVPSIMSPAAQSATPPSNGGTPVAMQAHIKSMPPPVNIPSHKRITSNGSPCVAAPVPSPPAVGVSATITTSSQGQAALQPSGAQEPSKGVVTGPYDTKRVPQVPASGLQPNLHSATDSHVSTSIASPSPSPPKAQTPQHPSPLPVVANGYHLPAVSGYTSQLAAVSHYPHSGVRPNLSAQQLQAYKSAFANMNIAQDGTLQTNGTQTPVRPLASYMTHTLQANADYHAQYQAARQMQWANYQRAQTSLDLNGLHNTMAANLLPATPTRVPSSNGPRGVAHNRRVPSPALGHTMTPVQGRTSPAVNHLTAHPPSPQLLSPSHAVA